MRGGPEIVPFVAPVWHPGPWAGLGLPRELCISFCTFRSSL